MGLVTESPWAIQSKSLLDLRIRKAHLQLLPLKKFGPSKKLRTSKKRCGKETDSKQDFDRCTLKSLMPAHSLGCLVPVQVGRFGPLRGTLTRAGASRIIASLAAAATIEMAEGVIWTVAD